MADKEIYVALLDSGCSFKTYEKVAIEFHDGHYGVFPTSSVKFKHGDTIGRIITQVPQVRLYDIQIFDENLRTTPHCLKTALEYLLDKDVQIIHMSLGMKNSFAEIEDLCKLFAKRGVTLVASFPRSGTELVYPASYKEVISVTADGRCSDNEISLLDENLLLFGANPFSNTEGVGGSSVSVAKFTKILCEYLALGYDKEETIMYIKKRSIR